jgi:exodeoxyribonuclease V beta subunit
VTARVAIPPAVAAMAFDRHHVVDASAGTGKTFLIEHRVVDLLLRGGAAIEDLLLVTFTEKATADLRARIRALLVELLRREGDAAPDGAPAWTLDAGARAALGRALRGLDRAAISTIHGFCQRVLGDAALESGRPFAQEAIAREAAFAAAFRGAMRELPLDPEAAAVLEAWRLAGRKLEPDGIASDLRKVLFLASEQRGVLAAPPTAAFEAALDRLAAAATTTDDGALAASIEAGLRKNSWGRARRELGAVVAAGRARAAGAAWPLALEALDPLEPKLAQTWSGLTGPAAALRDAALAAAALAPSLEDAAARVLLPAIERRLGRDKRRGGRFDFQDMLDDLWAALAGPSGDGLAARLVARHRFALIDEFQDTDPVQWRIFRRLYLERAGGWLTVVGDPKQAIYGFRGGDLETYLAACRDLEAAGAALTRLDTNYRSTPAVVEAVHALVGAGYFSALPCPPVAAGARRRLVDAADADVAPVVLHPVGGAIAPRFGDEIAALLAAPPVLRDGDARRPLRASDVFVLTRSTQESTDVAEALRARGVPCALYRQEGLFQTDEAGEVLDLLGAIAAPRDAGRRRRAFATRFFDVALADLAALDRAGDAHPYVERLLAWRGLADRRAYAELFARILDDSRVIERELLAAPSERALTNLGHVFEALLEATLDRRLELPELVADLARQVAGTADPWSDERNVQRRETDRDAVQIMTIHRAKGLEAAIVFVTGSTHAGARPPFVFHEGGERRVSHRKSAALRAAIDAEVRGEDERLYYVALTRAIGQLHLPLPAPLGEGKIGAGYGVLTANLHALAATPRAIVRAARGAAETPTPALDGWRPSAPPPRPAARPPLPRARRGAVTTSYSRLAHRVAPEARPELDADELRADLPQPPTTSPPPGLPPGKETGVYLHELLEHADLAAVRAAPDAAAWLARPDTAALLDRVMRRHGRPAAEREPSAAIVFAALTTPLPLDPPLRGVAWADRVAREVEFVFPLRGPDGERALVGGVIDLILEHGGRLWWLDWKSDVLPDYGPAALAAHVDGAYGVQAALYGAALARVAGADDPPTHAARVGGHVYLFLRGGAAHVATPGLAELEAACAALEVPA